MTVQPINLGSKGRRDLKVGLIAILSLFVIFVFAGLIHSVINEEIPLLEGVVLGIIIFFGVIFVVIKYREEEAKYQEILKTLDQQKQHILKRAKELKGQRLSLGRQDRLKKLLPLYRKLPDSLKPKLEERILLFQEMVEFWLSPGTLNEITEEMRDIVSAEACLLIINRSPADYLHLKLVEFWGSSIPSSDNKDIVGDASRERVRLNWNVIEPSLSEGADNHNTILHEFAHVLDFADDKITNSIPVSKDSAEYPKWKALLDKEYPKLLEAHHLNRNHVLDEYALSNPNRAEFFTCATESFFERSVRLKKENPEIYSLLKDFYNLDPAEWIKVP